MMSKHSSGPWEIRFEGREHEPGFGIASRIDNEMVCEAWFVARGPEWHERMKADARLIAAAPELLTALQGLMAEDVSKARMILEEPDYYSGTECSDADVLIAAREAAAIAAITKATH